MENADLLIFALPTELFVALYQHVSNLAHMMMPSSEQNNLMATSLRALLSKLKLWQLERHLFSPKRMTTTLTKLLDLLYAICHGNILKMISLNCSESTEKCMKSGCHASFLEVHKRDLLSFNSVTLMKRKRYVSMCINAVVCWHIS